jgi:hypothetical protein
MGNAKGTILVNAVKALRLKKDAAKEVLPEHLHRYLEERILAFAWYPEEDVLAILRALAKVTPDPGMDIYEFMGRIAARADLEGVYSNLLRPGDPDGSLRRASIIWRLYHDTGKQVVIESGDNSVVIEISGYQHPSRESCGTVKGWSVELVTLAGGKNVKVVHRSCVLDGEKACRFEVTWTR